MTTLRNSVNLIGRLGNDPEMKTFGENRRMARFSLATNDYYNDSEGKRVTETQWHNIVAWGKTNRRNSRKTPEQRQRSCHPGKTGKPLVRRQRGQQTLRHRGCCQRNSGFRK